MVRPKTAEKIPNTLDYKLWLGVAPDQPYSSAFIPHDWRGVKDFGCGAIGEAVAKLALSFGMKVYVYSYAKCKEVDGQVEYVSLDTLLSKSDIISLHIPCNKENKYFLGSLRPLP